MKPKSTRVSIPSATKHRLNEQFGSACAICRETRTATLEIHHIDGDVTNPVFENLLLVCATCHSEFSRGTKNPDDAKFFKRMGELGLLPPRMDAPAVNATGPVVNGGINNGVIGQNMALRQIC